MEVAIKYCGGCNPYYDRTALADKLKAAFPHIAFLGASERTVYDAAIILSGCTRRCVLPDSLNTRQGVFYVTSNDDYQKAYDFLYALSKSEE
ncbi:MAG: hypothetical protein ACOYJC_00325 [Christensenellales bacterium]